MAPQPSPQACVPGSPTPAVSWFCAGSGWQGGGGLSVRGHAPCFLGVCVSSPRWQCCVTDWIRTTPPAVGISYTSSLDLLAAAVAAPGSTQSQVSLSGAAMPPPPHLRRHRSHYGRATNNGMARPACEKHESPPSPPPHHRESAYAQVPSLLVCWAPGLRDAAATCQVRDKPNGVLVLCSLNCRLPERRWIVDG